MQISGMTTGGTLAGALADAQTVRQRLDVLTRQASDGLVADQYSGLGPQASRSLSLSPAIATARRLGAIVSATDVRPAAKEEIKSLGATFIGVEDDETQTLGRLQRQVDPVEWQRFVRDIDIALQHSIHGDQVVDADAVGRKGTGQRFGKRHQTTLGRRIGDQVRKTLNAVDGPHVQNAAATSGLHVGNGVLAAVEGAAQVHLLDGLP